MNPVFDVEIHFSKDFSDLTKNNSSSGYHVEYCILLTLCNLFLKATFGIHVSLFSIWERRFKLEYKEMFSPWAVV